MEADSEQLKELAFYAGEPKTYCGIDSSEGEHILFRGGRWFDGADAGVFRSSLDVARSFSHADFGGRSAYFKRHRTPVTESLEAER